MLETYRECLRDVFDVPGLKQVLGDVDQLLARLKRRLPADAAPLQRLQPPR